MNKKIYGCVAGAAFGDAMACATEGKSYRQIVNIFGHKVEDFETPDTLSVSYGLEKASFTDAFTIPMYLINEIYNSKEMSKKTGEQALYNWSKTPYALKFAGMTTKNVIINLNQNYNADWWSINGKLGSKIYKGHYYALSSNGAAVKAFPAGILSKSKEEVIDNTFNLTLASHDDPYSVSGACAVAMAIYEVLNGNSNLDSVIQSCIDSSIKGENIARNYKGIWDYPGPSVTRRLELAVSIVKNSINHDDAIENLRDIIGSGPAISETVPVAIGIILANEGDFYNSIYDAVNIGDETCAIASIVGSILGCLYGIDVFTKNEIEIINKTNDINLEKIANKLCIN